MIKQKRTRARHTRFPLEHKHTKKYMLLPLSTHRGKNNKKEEKVDIVAGSVKKSGLVAPPRSSRVELAAGKGMKACASNRDCVCVCVCTF